MSTGSRADVEQRADRLLRWYPKAWRDRYGEEFAALLADDIANRPRSLRRAADVIRCGISARLSIAGITDAPVVSCDAAIATTTVVSVILGVASVMSLWAQLVRGWQLAPASDALAAGATGTSLALVLMGALLVTGAARVAPGLLRAARRSPRRVAAALLPLVAGAAGLAGGGVLMAGRIGAGRPELAGGGLVGFARAETYWINTFWVHPDLLRRLPGVTLGWLLASPALLALVVWGMHRTLGMLPVPTIRRVTRTARHAAGCAAVALLTGAGWVVGSQHSAVPTLRAGTLDLTLLCLLLAASAVGITAGRGSQGSPG